MAAELEGSEALLNLSLLAITFATVTALVMLVRQTIGGKLSGFDVYLITSYVSLGFVIAIDATLPSIFVLFDLPPTALWAIVSMQSLPDCSDPLPRRTKTEAPVAPWIERGAMVFAL